MNNNNPLYSSEIYGSSAADGTLSLSGVGPGAPGGDIYLNPQGGNTGIGTNNPSNTLSVYGNADVSGTLGVNGMVTLGTDLNAGGRITDKTGPVMPVGSIIAWAGGAQSQIPSGWLVCNGASVPAQYTDLIALIGPNTPNLCGRTLIGTGQPNNNQQSDGTCPNFDPNDNWPSGYTGGEYQHTLVENEIPAHTHFVGGYNKQPNNIADSDSDISCPDCWMWNDAKTTTSTGGSQPHNNMQPYFAVNYIIKC